MQAVAATEAGQATLRDVIVIGSGFGGAVAAARLAERGLDVLVLERGPWWGAGGHDAPREQRRPFPRGRRLHRLLRNVRWARGRHGLEVRLHPDGLWEWHALPSADVLTASGVGGGSLVYTNIQEAPEESLFDAFPPELTGAELSPHVAAVQALLRPTASPHTLARDEAFARAVAAAGRAGVERPALAVAWADDRDAHRPQRNAAGVLQGTCVDVGECILGCRYGAKASLDLTFVPRALTHGAAVRALSEVVAIGRDGSAYLVRYRDHRRRRYRVVRSRRLVLAAGTLNTVRLLLTARDRHRTLPRLPRRLGHGFSLNGDALTLLWRAAALPEPTRGPTISALHRVRDEQGRHRLAVGEAALPYRALLLPRRLRHALATSTALFGYGREQAQPPLRLVGGQLTSTAARSGDRRFYEELEDAMRTIDAAYRPARILLQPTRRRDGRLRSVHPLGGAAVGTSAEDGVVDHAGRVFGHPGLYVVDGSIMPAAPGIPPSLTIAAFADRAATLMVTG